MSVLNQVVSALNKEEVRNLKLFLNRTNAGKERKDVQLFDFIRKSAVDYEENKILQRLYGKSDKNSFYRLKNRLLEDIGKSITLQYFNSSDTNQVLYYLALSRLYRDKNQFKAALYYLRKSEKKAIQISAFELLDIIYTDYIKHSQESLSINPEVYLKKRKTNRVELNKIRDIDDILSVLIYRIKKSQNFAGRNDHIIQILQKTIDEYSGGVKLAGNAQLRFKIYHAVSRILLQQHDYNSLEEYLLNSLDTFTREELFNKNNHDTKLQLLTYLVNALTKNRKYEEAMRYIDMLELSMTEYNRIFYNKYLFYYYNAKSLVYSFIQEKEKAISLLEEALSNKEIVKAIPHSQIIFYINLALLHFDRAEFRQSSRILVKLKLDEGFDKLDEGFQLKLGIVELIIRYELKDFDYIEYQSGQIKKDFEHLLKDAVYERQKRMMEVLLEMIYTSNFNQNNRLTKKVEFILNDMSTEDAADSDILNYHDWLRSYFKEDNLD